MKDYAWPVAFLAAAAILTMGFGSSVSPEKCEKICAPRGVSVYIDSSGRCECESFAGSK